MDATCFEHPSAREQSSNSYCYYSNIPTTTTTAIPTTTTTTATTTTATTAITTLYYGWPTAQTRRRT